MLNLQKDSKDFYYQLDSYDYTLPEELIATHPQDNRSSSQLLNCEVKSNFKDQIFSDLLDLLNKNDVLVLNNTKVLAARLYAEKLTKGKVELLIERIDNNNKRLALSHIKSNKSLKTDTRIIIDKKFHARVLDKTEDGLYIIALDETLDSWYKVLETSGHMPLPPYMQREAQDEDKLRYQTVFAEKEGAVAAPTAGLHFNQELLDKLQAKGVIITYVTLHVGSGTFRPVRVDNILDHKMHAEYIDVSKETANIIKQAKKDNHRIVAVGTTVLRTLESAYNINGNYDLEYSGDTNIFIYPGFEFKVIDILITNFHLPKSTLLMLVAAFAGYDKIMLAYATAIERKYKFYSYGDAMILYRK
tara:strand:+ start:133 stop:1209 length:1077 start_codon:yes stop_codon:yes gene_type:complete